MENLLGIQKAVHAFSILYKVKFINLIQIQAELESLEPEDNRAVSTGSGKSHKESSAVYFRYAGIKNTYQDLQGPKYNCGLGSFEELAASSNREIYEMKVRHIIMVIPFRSGIRVRQFGEYRTPRPNTLVTEVSHLQQAPNMAEKLLKGFQHKLDKASSNIKNTITLEKCISTFEKFLQHLENCKNSKYKIKNIYTIIQEPCFLLFAFASIKNRSVAPGVVDISITKVTLASIVKLAVELKSHSYTAKPVERVMIPKLNGGQRPLGIASAKDKIVQTAVLLLLEPYYDPKFLNYSHGFRRGRSAHTCLDNMSKH